MKDSLAQRTFVSVNLCTVMGVLALQNGDLHGVSLEGFERISSNVLTRKTVCFFRNHTHSVFPEGIII